MNEMLEADKFNKELDNLLAGARVDENADSEILKDLQLASRLAASDLSGRSSVRTSLKVALLNRGEAAARRSWLSLPPFRRLLPYAALAAIGLLVPITYQLLFDRQYAQGMFSARPSPFGRSGSPYEPGMAGLAPGAMSSRSNSLTSVKSDVGYHGVAGKRGNSPAGGIGDLKKAAERAASEFNRGGGAANMLTAAESSQAIPASPAVAPAKPMSELKEGDRHQSDFDREGYSFIKENEFVKASDQPLSTFSIDVDAASYANARRFLNNSAMPPPDAVRVEEFINYFRYDYPEPAGEHPFSITAEAADCPWKPEHKLVRIGIKGKSMPKHNLPPSNLVFLVDTSGSMQSENKLPLLKKAFKLLVEQLRAKDRIAIVAYAGSAGIVLPSTPGDHKDEILGSLGQLQAGGSTAGGEGLVLAYKVAGESFLEKGNNRVILATDGDFNVGVTSDGDLVRMIEEKREAGVFLTVLGFGEGNYQDAKMEQLADKGNGNYSYIDDIAEAERVLVQEMSGTLLTIAKDVKLQVEFNPARAQAYRLIGYENRALAAQDFNDDKKDAGELGAGHTVTALYEVIPVGVQADLPGVDELKYQKTKPADDASASRELLTVKFRYKKPDGHKSLLIARPLEDRAIAWDAAPRDFKFAASAAGFAMLLRGSKFAGSLTYGKVEAMAKENLGPDEGGWRAEMVRLAGKARLLDQRQR